MDLLLFVLALVAFAILAARFGADSGPRLLSDEERFASYGMQWDLPLAVIAQAPVDVSPAEHRELAA